MLLGALTLGSPNFNETLSMLMDIRVFNESDRQGVIALWELCELIRPWNDPDKDIDRKVSYQSNLFLVGTVNATVVASAMAGYDGHRGSVFYLAVHPEYQGKGLGAQLMAKIEDLLTEMGCPKINIVIRSSNARVLAFYNRLGYTVDDVTSVGKRQIPDA